MNEKRIHREKVTKKKKIKALRFFCPRRVLVESEETLPLGSVRQKRLCLSALPDAPHEMGAAMLEGAEYTKYSRFAPEQKGNEIMTHTKSI